MKVFFKYAYYYPFSNVLVDIFYFLEEGKNENKQVFGKSAC